MLVEIAEQRGDRGRGAMSRATPRATSRTTSGATPGADPTPYETFPSRRPQLVGWSLGLVGFSNVGLVTVALLAGLSPIGLMSCVALGLMSWLLVVAEILSVRRFRD